VISGNRIGILRNDGHFWVKEGSLYETWVDEAASVYLGFLAGDRIGVLTTEPPSSRRTFLVKQGTLFAGWVNEASGVFTGALAGDRIGVFFPDRTCLVKEGSLFANWTVQSQAGQGLFQLALSSDNNRIAINVQNPSEDPLAVNDSYTFKVREGALDAPWVEESSNVMSVVLPTN
jgi:hypothetical protein